MATPSIAASLRPGARFRVGEALVEPELHRVVVGGTSTTLEPKIMAVLVELARCPGEVRTREELITSVWNGDYVTEDVLTRAITELRKVFGDDPRRPRVIETIRKRGYRLVAACEADAAPALVTRHELGPEGAAEPERRRFGTRAATVAAAATLAAVLGVWAFAASLRDRSAAAREAKAASAAAGPLRIQPLTADPGQERDPAVSPDGRRVAWVKVIEEGAGEEARAHLWIKSLDDDGERELTNGPFEDRHPTWSPTGTALAFARLEHTPEASRCELLVLALEGGTPRRLTTCDPDGPLHMDWSPDGRSLAIPSRRDQGYGISLLDIESLEIRPVTEPKPPYRADVEPVFAPDGRTLAFTRVVTSSVADVWLTDLETGEERRVTDDSSDVIGQTFTVDGRALVYSSSRAGVYGLWQIDLEDGAATWLTGSGNKIKHPRHARAAPVLAWEDWRFEIGIVAQELDGDGSAEPRVVVSSTQWDFAPQPAPDGTRLAFVSSRSGAHQLWLDRLDGSDPVQLTRGEGQVTSMPRWSPDGSRLVFTAFRDGQNDLFVISPGDLAMQRVSDDPEWELQPSFTADGRALLYTSHRDERWRIWRRPLDGSGAPELALVGEALAAQPAPQGGLLFVRPGQVGLFWARGDREPELLTSNLPRHGWGDWVVTAQGVYYLASGAQYELRFVDWTGRDRAVARLDEVARQGLGLSPDGRTLYYARPGRAECDIMVARNLDARPAPAERPSG